MGKFKQYKDLEQRLEEKTKNRNENVVALEKEDFKNGKLSAQGYNRLKQNCEYIPYSENIEIVVPEDFAEGFKDTLESLGADELTRIKKDMRRAGLMAAMLLAVGVFWFALGYFLESVDFIKEITSIATWVFVWSAIEKVFFERTKLQDKRMSLLQILSAEIKSA